jgi:serine/threonine protein kinase/Tfp pilus assembly protein PilF
LTNVSGREGSQPGPDDESTVTASSSVRVATQIGDFRIVRQLGAGGMGIVYEAEQQNPKRPVALKVIRGGSYVDDTRVRMFRREVQTLARLRHPGIAAIYESGRTDDGQYFFAMELVRGDTLSDHLKHRTADRALVNAEVNERLALFCRICDAISYAHQRGVIHRDLKPANILVLREGPISDSLTKSASLPAVPGIKVLDFGLARIIDTDVAASTVLTDLGSVQGTLPYMSPEQVRGNPDEIDLRTDVYSLGVLLYGMLSGQLPLDVNRTQLPEALRIICDEPPRPLAQTWQGERRLDSDLATIVHKALEKEPARRYQSASALAEDVQRYLTDQPILARPPNAVYQLRKLARRHKAAFAFVAALFVLLAGFGVAMTVQARRITHERDRANREAETSKHVLDFLVGLFKISDPSEARGNAVTAREILDKGAETIRAELGGQPLMQARLMETMGDVYKSLGLYDASRPLLEKSLELRRMSLGEDHLDVAESRADLADLDRLQASFAAAESLLELALATRQEQLGPDHPLVALTLCDLAVVYSRQGKNQKAEPAFEKALAIDERALGPESAEVARVLNELGTHCYRQGRYAESEPFYKRALAVWEKALGPEHPEVARALNNLAIAYRNLGNYAGAQSLFARALAIREKTLGAEHPQVATVLNNLALVHVNRRDYAGAELLYNRALMIYEKALGPEHPDVATVLNNLANLKRHEKDYAEAESHFRRALAIRERALGPEHVDVAWSLLDLGALERERKRYQAAEPLFRRALTIFELAHHETGTALTLRDLAHLYEARGDYATAEECFKRAVQIFEQGLGSDPPSLASCLEGYAKLLHKMKRDDEAQALQQRAAAIRADTSTNAEPES